MAKVTVYQMSSRRANCIEAMPETEEQAIARRTKDWPEHDSDPANCTGHGHDECVRQGEHSWFNHSMDSYYKNPGSSNLPNNHKEI
jgi:hypothetical protein